MFSTIAWVGVGIIYNVHNYMTHCHMSYMGVACDIITIVSLLIVTGNPFDKYLQEIKR